MIRPAFVPLIQNSLSLRGRVRACPVLDTGVGASLVALASALLMLLALACGTEPTATPVLSQPTAVSQPANTPRPDCGAAAFGNAGNGGTSAHSTSRARYCNNCGPGCSDSDKRGPY